MENLFTSEVSFTSNAHSECQKYTFATLRFLHITHYFLHKHKHTNTSCFTLHYVTWSGIVHMMTRECDFCHFACDLFRRICSCCCSQWTPVMNIPDYRISCRFNALVHVNPVWLSDKCRKKPHLFVFLSTKIYKTCIY